MVLNHREHDFNARLATSYLRVRDIGNGSIAGLVAEELLEFRFRLANSAFCTLMTNRTERSGSIG